MVSFRPQQILNTWVPHIASCDSQLEERGQMDDLRQKIHRKGQLIVGQASCQDEKICQCVILAASDTNSALISSGKRELIGRRRGCHV